MLRKLNDVEKKKHSMQLIKREENMQTNLDNVEK